MPSGASDTRANIQNFCFRSDVQLFQKIICCLYASDMKFVGCLQIVCRECIKVFTRSFQRVCYTLIQTTVLVMTYD